jgi:transposase-like protein
VRNTAVLQVRPACEPSLTNLRWTEILVSPISMASTNSENIATLQKKWPTLNDLDRARAVHQIHQAGTSYRKLAQALHCSESLLRNLNQAAQASALDQALARKGKISTRELVRRAKADQAVRKAKERKAAEQKRAKLVQLVADKICEWLDQEGFSSSQGEAIVDNARWLLNDAETSGNLPPPPPAPPGTPLTEIVEKLRPSRSITEGADEFGAHALWLLRWVYFALSDSIARHKALSKALDRLIKN